MDNNLNLEEKGPFVLNIEAQLRKEINLEYTESNLDCLVDSEKIKMALPDQDHS